MRILTCVQDDSSEDRFDKRRWNMRSEGSADKRTAVLLLPTKTAIRLDQPINIKDEAEDQQGKATDQTEAITP